MCVIVIIISSSDSDLGGLLSPIEDLPARVLCSWQVDTEGYSLEFSIYS